MNKNCSIAPPAQDVDTNIELAGTKLDTATQNNVKTKNISVSKVPVLIVLSVLMILSRSCHTLLAQPWKKLLVSGDERLDMPVFHALVEASSFPLSILFWFFIMKYKNLPFLVVPNWRYRIKMYMAMALLDAINSTFGAIGMNILPAAIYTILKSTSIIFSVLFARTLTRKQINVYQYLAASILVGNTVIITCSTSSMDFQSEKGFDTTMLFGLISCLISSLCVSFLGVLTYMFFVHEKVKGSLAVVAENNAFQAMFMWVFLLPLLATPEFATWNDSFDRIRENGRYRMFLGCSIGLWLCRPVAEFCGVAVTAFSSNVMTRALGGPRRLLIVIGSFFLFNEPMTRSKLVAVLVMSIALAVYIYGGIQLQKEKRRKTNLETILHEGYTTKTASAPPLQATSEAV